MWMAPNGTLGASTLKGNFSAALTLNNVQTTAPFAAFGKTPRLLVRPPSKVHLCHHRIPCVFSSTSRSA